jgi:hypothetical protein
MNEEIVAPNGSFFQHTDFNELFKLTRGRLATGNVSLNEILNTAVRQAGRRSNRPTHDYRFSAQPVLHA